MYAGAFYPFDNLLLLSKGRDIDQLNVSIHRWRLYHFLFITALHWSILPIELLMPFGKTGTPCCCYYASHAFMSSMEHIQWYEQQIYLLKCVDFLNYELLVSEGYQFQMPAIKMTS